MISSSAAVALGRRPPQLRPLPLPGSCTHSHAAVPTAIVTVSTLPEPGDLAGHPGPGPGCGPQGGGPRSRPRRDSDRATGTDSISNRVRRRPVTVAVLRPGVGLAGNSDSESGTPPSSDSNLKSLSCSFLISSLSHGIQQLTQRSSSKKNILERS